MKRQREENKWNRNTMRGACAAHSNFCSFGTTMQCRCDSLAWMLERDTGKEMNCCVKLAVNTTLPVPILSTQEGISQRQWHQTLRKKQMCFQSSWLSFFQEKNRTGHLSADHQINALLAAFLVALTKTRQGNKELFLLRVQEGIVPSLMEGRQRVRWWLHGVPSQEERDECWSLSPVYSA